MSGTAEYIIQQLESEVTGLPDYTAESLQHLFELGYLPMFKANALLPGDVEKAETIFLAEAEESGFFDTASEPAIYLNPRDQLQAWLRKATDINDGIAFKSLPVAGTPNLAARIIHYRLELLGLWPMPITGNFSALTLEKINELAEYTKTAPLEAINFPANIDRFSRQLMANNPPEKFVVIFKSPHVANETKKHLDRRQAFKRQLVSDFGERSDYIRFLAREILKNNPAKIDYAYLSGQSNDPFSRFVMRLVQLQQWEEGFYNGLLDSDIGEVTIRSILDAIDFYNATEDQQIKSYRVITSLQGDYFLFNALFFLQHYTTESDETDAAKAREAIVENISGDLEKADANEKEMFQKHFLALKSEIFDENKTQPTEKKGLLKRIYYGLRNLFKKVFRFAGKIFRWISEKVKGMWNFLKNIFRNIFEDMRLAISAFVEGIQFIFGQRTFETDAGGQAIVSWFGIDGDSTSITTNRIEEVLQQHLAKTSFGIKSMRFAMAVVEGVLTIIVRALSIITWPLLLLQITSVYNKIIHSFNELKLTTN